MKRRKLVKIKFQKNSKGRWYWVAVSPNGRKFFASMESDGYKSRSASVKNFNSVARVFALRAYIFE